MGSNPASPIETALSALGKCILVVEDELLIRFALSDVLRDEGYRVIEACSADEALEAMATVALDLVISDVRMPGSMDGIALLAAIRKSFSALPVIIVSGHLQPSIALADGATQFLSKPYAFEAMIEAIKMAFGGENEPRQ